MSESGAPSPDTGNKPSNEEVSSSTEGGARAGNSSEQSTALSELGDQERYVHLQGSKDHYKHKYRWSNFLLGALGTIFVAQTVFMLLVGVKWLDFKSYPGLLQLYVVQNLVQIVGLASIAVISLFKDIHYPGTQRSRKRQRRRTRREAYHT